MKISKYLPGINSCILVVLIIVCSINIQATNYLSNNRTSENNTEVNTTIRVMSYNIHHCDPPYNTGSQVDLDTTTSVIAAQHPDIVALQEVDMNSNRSGNVNQAKKIADKLGMYYFFAPTINIPGGQYGIAILSKYAFTEAVIHNFPFPDTSGEKRVLATVKITLPDGTDIRFGNTHFDLKTENKKAEIAEIISIGEKEPLPFIIAGDLNSWEESGVIATLDTKFTRTCNDCSFTSPANNPQHTIDYIAFRHPENKFTVISHKVVNERYASDHRPIVAEIGILSETLGVNMIKTNVVKLIGRKLMTENPIRISIYNLLGILILEKNIEKEIELPNSLGKGIFIVNCNQGTQKLLLN